MVIHKNGWTYIYHISINGEPPVLLGDLSPTKQRWAKRELSTRMAAVLGLRPSEKDLELTAELKRQWEEEERNAKAESKNNSDSD